MSEHVLLILETMMYALTLVCTTVALVQSYNDIGDCSPGLWGFVAARLFYTFEFMDRGIGFFHLPSELVVVQAVSAVIGTGLLIQLPDCMPHESLFFAAVLHVVFGYAYPIVAVVKLHM